MQEKLSKMLEEAKAQLNKATSLADTEEIRVKVLGKKGQLTEILRSMEKLPPEEKKADVYKRQGIFRCDCRQRHR